MTIVGPRPEMPFVVAQYERWQNLRHLATPGLTCIWQTTVRKTVPLENPEATKLDLEYLNTASPLLDSRLMLRTIRAIFFHQGAF
jgi:lipopolysaccharide/colanic/teichoic acid biosynthesis glycosyltransferase